MLNAKLGSAMRQWLDAVHMLHKSELARKHKDDLEHHHNLYLDTLDVAQAAWMKKTREQIAPVLAASWCSASAEEEKKSASPSPSAATYEQTMMA